MLSECRFVSFARAPGLSEGQFASFAKVLVSQVSICYSFVKASVLPGFQVAGFVNHKLIQGLIRLIINIYQPAHNLSS